MYQVRLDLSEVTLQGYIMPTSDAVEVMDDDHYDDEEEHEMTSEQRGAPYSSQSHSRSG
jgi:hypothetical protein